MTDIKIEVQDKLGDISAVFSHLIFNPKANFLFPCDQIHWLIFDYGYFIEIGKLWFL